MAALRSERVSLLGVGLVALAVRVVVVLVTHRSFALINDAADYNRLAISLAGGHGFGVSHVAPGGGPTALRPPAFPLLLAAVYLVFGSHVVAARLLGALLGAVSAVLVGILIAQLTHDRVRSLIGGILAAVFPPMVIASTSVMSEGLFVALSLVVVVCALAYRAEGRVRWLALSGLALGCATLTRPIGAVLVLPAALIAFTGPPAPRRWVAALAATGLAIAPCLAWEIRDVTVMSHVIPLTTQDGYFLAGTYNATSAHYRPQPGNWIPANDDPATARLIAAHPHAGEVRLNDLLHHAALHYLGAHPTYFFTVVGNNFLRLFDLTDRAFAQAAVRGEYGYGSFWGAADYFSTLVILALAVLGFARGGLRGWPAGAWLAPLLLLVVTLPTRANPRFRAPIDPYLIALASAAFVGWARGGARSLSLRRQPGGS